MAHIYRPSYTKFDPKSGRRVTRKVRKWYGKYRDAAGQLRCVPLCKDKRAALAMLADLVRRAEQQRAGLVFPAAVLLAGPIDEHLADFRVHLEAKARSTRHIRETIRIIRNVVTACGLGTLLELQDAGVLLERYLYDRRRPADCGRRVRHFRG